MRLYHLVMDFQRTGYDDMFLFDCSIWYLHLLNGTPLIAKTLECIFKIKTFSDTQRVSFRSFPRSFACPVWSSFAPPHFTSAAASLKVWAVFLSAQVPALLLNSPHYRHLPLAYHIALIDLRSSLFLHEDSSVPAMYMMLLSTHARRWGHSGASVLLV